MIFSGRLCIVSSSVPPAGIIGHTFSAG
jgi:hypothetical protein